MPVTRFSRASGAGLGTMLATTTLGYLEAALDTGIAEYRDTPRTYAF